MQKMSAERQSDLKPCTYEQVQTRYVLSLAEAERSARRQVWIRVPKAWLTDSKEGCLFRETELSGRSMANELSFLVIDGIAVRSAILDPDIAAESLRQSTYLHAVVEETFSSDREPRWVRLPSSWVTPGPKGVVASMAEAGERSLSAEVLSLIIDGLSYRSAARKLKKD